MSSSSRRERLKKTCCCRQRDQFDAGLRRRCPPPTRKLAHGCVTLNGTLVSVPAWHRRRDSRSRRSSIAPGGCCACPIAPCEDGVALDGLARRRHRLGGPVLEGAGLEIEIERPPVRGGGLDRLGPLRLRGGQQRQGQGEAGKGDNGEQEENGALLDHSSMERTRSALKYRGNEVSLQKCSDFGGIGQDGCAASPKRLMELRLVCRCA